MAKKSTFWSDFKAFISRGNVLDMAIGVVIGGAFGKITSGLVSYIISPLISLLTGGVDLASVRTILRYNTAEGTLTKLVSEAALDELGNPVVAVAIDWGLWIQTIIDFLVIALAIFTVLRIITKSQAILHENELAAKAKAEAEAKEKADAEAAALAEQQAAEKKLDEDAKRAMIELCELLKNKQ